MKALFLTVLTAATLDPLQLASICDYAEITGDVELLEILARHPGLDAATDARVARRPEAAVRVAWMCRPGRDAAAVRQVLGQEKRITILAAVAAVTTIDDVLRSELAAVGHPRIAEPLLRTGSGPRSVDLAAYRTLSAAPALTWSARQLLNKGLADGEVLAAVAGIVSSVSVDQVIKALAGSGLRLDAEVYQHLLDVVTGLVDLRAKAREVRDPVSSNDRAYTEVSALRMLRDIAALPAAPLPVTDQIRGLVRDLCDLADLGEHPKRGDDTAGAFAQALAEAWFEVLDVDASTLTREAAKTRDPRRLEAIATAAVRTDNAHAAAAVLLNPHVGASAVATIWSAGTALRQHADLAKVAAAHRERLETLLTVLDLCNPWELRELLAALHRPDRLVRAYLAMLAACGADVVPIRQEHVNVLLDLPLMTPELLRRVPVQFVAAYSPPYAGKQPNFGAALAEVLQPAAGNRLAASALAALAENFDGRLGDMVAAAVAAST